MAQTIEIRASYRLEQEGLAEIYMGGFELHRASCDCLPQWCGEISKSSRKKCTVGKRRSALARWKKGALHLHGGKKGALRLHGGKGSSVLARWKKGTLRLHGGKRSSALAWWKKGAMRLHGGKRSSVLRHWEKGDLRLHGGEKELCAGTVGARWLFFLLFFLLFRFKLEVALHATATGNLVNKGNADK